VDGGPRAPLLPERRALTVQRTAGYTRYSLARKGAATAKQPQDAQVDGGILLVVVNRARGLRSREPTYDIAAVAVIGGRVPFAASRSAKASLWPPAWCAGVAPSGAPRGRRSGRESRAGGGRRAPSCLLNRLSGHKHAAAVVAEREAHGWRGDESTPRAVAYRWWRAEEGPPSGRLRTLRDRSGSAGTSPAGRAARPIPRARSRCMSAHTVAQPPCGAWPPSSRRSYFRVRKGQPWSLVGRVEGPTEPSCTPLAIARNADARIG
jgi:hypothetical protein